MSKTPRASRRDFLRGKAATDAMSHQLDGHLSDSDTPGEKSSIQRSEDEPYLVCLSRRAMACHFQIYLNAGQHEEAADSAIRALDLVEEVEAQLTVYRDDSEVSEMNVEAVDGPVFLDPDLFGLLAHSIELSQSTQGAFDITAGPLSRVWGFARRAGELPKKSDLETARKAVGYQLLKLDDSEDTIEFLAPSVEVNLGGIGKGYSLDQAAELLEDSEVSNFLFHGGNSSVLARGAHAQREEGWVVGLAHPLRPQQRLAEITLRNHALSTSGSGTQFFQHEGRRMGHILDPRTGWPAEGVLSATVITDSAATADALSTALFVMGPEAAREFCERHREVGAILVMPGERSGTIQLEHFNLSDQQWKRTDS